MTDETRLEQLPTISEDLLRAWPRPPDGPERWDLWSPATRQAWLLDQTFEEVDGGWAVSDDPSKRQVRDQVLHVLETTSPEALLMVADLISEPIGVDDSIDSEDATRRWKQLRFALAGALLLIVTAALIVSLTGDGTPGGHDEVATQPDRPPATTVHDPDVEQPAPPDADAPEQDVAPVDVAPVDDGPGIAPTTTMPGHEDFLGTFSDGETGIRLGADGTYTLVMTAGSDEGRFRLVRDDDGQVRLQLLEPGEEFVFRIAMPVALHPDGLWWGTTEGGRLLPRATSLPTAPTTGDRVVLAGEAIDDVRFIWRTQYPNLELGREGTRTAELELDAVTGQLELDLATGAIAGDLMMAFRSSPDDQHVSATGRATFAFEPGTIGRDGRGDNIRGRARADVTFTGELRCAEGACDGSYRALVDQEYLFVVGPDGQVRFEFAWTAGYDEIVVGSALDPAAYTVLSGWFTGQGERR